MYETHRARFVVHASLCFAVGILVPANGVVTASTRAHASTPLTSFSLQLRDSTVPGKPVFRLGNAARPFGWSTAIGDFDRDGMPDVAVADHIGRQVGGYAYRIELSLSHTASADITFESTADAITIRTVDIDHDNDLDIVVGHAVSGDAVGVWLNDGHGHFTATDVRQFSSLVPGLPTLGTTEPHVDVAAFDSSPRRARDGLPAAPLAVFSDWGERVLASRRSPFVSSFVLLRAAPRAPPQLSADAQA